MFQSAAVIVKLALVQSPCDCVGPSKTRAGGAVVDVVACTVVELPWTSLVVVDEPDTPEVVVDCAPVVVEEVLAAPAAPDVVVAPLEPAGAGREYPGVVLDPVAAEPPLL